MVPNKIHSFLVFSLDFLSVKSTSTQSTEQRLFLKEIKVLPVIVGQGVLAGVTELWEQQVSDSQRLTGVKSESNEQS